ncbi:hypothetical protein FO519_003100 [Halicephalobus sp. NKZ332]|nr:hypothetical protein FO519_003100 [Halicephalobus sp. NKZ332]
MSVPGTGQHRGPPTQSSSRNPPYLNDIFGQPGGNAVIGMPPGTSYTETSRDGHTMVDITTNGILTGPNIPNMGNMTRPMYMMPRYPMYPPAMYQQMPVVTSMPQASSVYHQMQSPQNQIPQQQQQRSQQPPLTPHQKKIIQLINPDIGNTYSSLDNNDAQITVRRSTSESDSPFSPSKSETNRSSVDEVRHNFSQQFTANAFPKRMKNKDFPKRRQTFEKSFSRESTSLSDFTFNNRRVRKSESEFTGASSASRKEDMKNLLTEYEQKVIEFTEDPTNMQNLSKAIYTRDFIELLRDIIKNFKTAPCPLSEEKLRELHIARRKPNPQSFPSNVSRYRYPPRGDNFAPTWGPSTRVNKDYTSRINDNRERHNPLQRTQFPVRPLIQRQQPQKVQRDAYEFNTLRRPYKWRSSGSCSADPNDNENDQKNTTVIATNTTDENIEESVKPQNSVADQKNAHPTEEEGKGQSVAKKNLSLERKSSNSANRQDTVDQRDKCSEKDEFRTVPRDSSNMKSNTLINMKNATNQRVEIPDEDGDEDEGEWQTVTKKITYYDRKFNNTPNQKPLRPDEGRQGGRDTTRPMNRY